MNKYEVLYVIDAGMEDQARSELIAQFGELMTNNGATVEKVDEGYYVLVNFTAAPEFPRELERNFEINENIMRYLVTRVEE